MAQKVQVLLVDDLDGGEATETVSFGLDGSSYEIDLSSANADKIRKELALYIEKARKVSAPARRRRPRTGPGRGTGRPGRLIRGVALRRAQPFISPPCFTVIVRLPRDCAPVAIDPCASSRSLSAAAPGEHPRGQRPAPIRRSLAA